MTSYKEIIKKYQEDFLGAMAADLEHGVAWMNEEASKEFAKKYPELLKVLTRFYSLMDDEDGY
jgi:hypothetical protein